jgi:thiol peroxidase
MTSAKIRGNMTSVKLKGNEIKIKGNLPAKGTTAPVFNLVAQDLSEVELDSFGVKKKLLNIFPSMDTSVCSKSMHTFYERCKSIPDLVVLNVSMDLPFAASRFCKNEGMENALTLSAFRSSFSDDYGLKILDGPLKGLCTRAVILLSPDNKVEYIELVPEITQEPDYEKVLNLIL